jgi:hypothetical protein
VTDAEKIEQVEQALEGTAEARRGFQCVFEDRFFYFCTGQYDTKADKTERYFEAELDRALGATRSDEIFGEEFAKWVAKTQPTVDPEVWQVFMLGTEEEQNSFPT